MSQYRPTVMTVSLSAIANNFPLAKTVVHGQPRRMAVVKADAYGHGMLPVAKRLIREGAEAAIKVFVLHPSTPVTEGMPRQERKKNAMEILDTLAEVAHREGGVVAVEDMIRSCIGNSAQELKELISANDKLRVCFDVNHLFNNTHEEFISILGPKIVHTHISDYDFQDEKHWFPGEGSICWPAVYSALKKAGYSGVWNYEVGLTGAKMADRGRALTYHDVYSNAMEIFSGRDPSVIRAAGKM